MNKIQALPQSVEKAKRIYGEDPAEEFLIETSNPHIFVRGHKAEVPNKSDSPLFLTTYHIGDFDFNDYIKSNLFNPNTSIIPTDIGYYPIATNYQSTLINADKKQTFTNHYSFEVLNSFREMGINTMTLEIRNKIENLLPEVVNSNALMVVALLKKYEVSGYYQDTKNETENAAQEDKSIKTSGNIYPKLIELNQKTFEKEHLLKLQDKINTYTKKMNSAEFLDSNTVATYRSDAFGTYRDTDHIPVEWWCNMVRNELDTRVFRLKLKKEEYKLLT